MSEGNSPARRRTKFEIKADILRAALGGAKKSEIYHKANINPTAVNRWIKPLLNNSLLRHNDKNYHTTAKGEKYLQHFDAMRELEE